MQQPVAKARSAPRETSVADEPGEQRGNAVKRLRPHAHNNKGKSQ